MDAGHHPSNHFLANRGWIRSLSIGALLAVATYAALLALWPAHPAICVAETVVGLRSVGNAVRLPALSAGELALLCGVYPDGPVRLETTANSSEMRIRLIATACSPRTALQRVESSAQQFLQGAPAYVSARTTGYQDEQSDGHEDACWTALQLQLNKLVQCENSLSCDGRLVDEAGSTTAGETVPVSTDIDPSVSALNPAWIKANDELEAERARLDELLKTRTAQHPEVQAARSNIEHLTGRLDQIPLLAPPTTVPNESTTQADHEVNTSLADMLTNLRQEIGQLDMAKSELKSAFDKYSSARSVARNRAVPPTLPLWFAETSRPASLLQRAQGRGPASHPELLLIAICTAFALTRWVTAQGSQVLQNISEARSWGAQVAGVFGDVHAPIAAGPNEWMPRIIQLARWGALVLLAMSLMLAAGDPLFVGNLWHDPAMAVRDAWQHWVP